MMATQSTPPRPRDIDNAVMPFGRHAGMLFYELVVEDWPYVMWLLQQPWLDAGVAASLKAAVAEYRADCAAENDAT
jgi:hypothetical protein